MEFNIISSCLGKVEVFSSLTWQSKLTFDVCMKTIYLAVPHCFFKTFHLQQSQGILGSPLWIPVARTKNKSRQFLFVWSEKRFLPFKLYTNYSQEKSNYKESHAYLTDSQYSTCLLKNLAYSICHRVEIYRPVTRLTSSFR